MKLTFTTQPWVVTTVTEKPYENTGGEKGENAGNQRFLLFPHSVFLCFIDKFYVLFHMQTLSSANAFNLDKAG